MKDLYSVISNPLVWSALYEQANDTPELTGLAEIFNIIAEFIDEKRKTDNKYEKSPDYKSGRMVCCYTTEDNKKFKDLKSSIQKYINIAKSISITNELEKTIASNRFEYITGSVRDKGDKFFLNLLVPHGMKLDLYSVAIYAHDKDHILVQIVLAPLDPKSGKTGVITWNSNSREDNFAIPCDKSILKLMKGFLYDLKGFVRG